MRVTRSKPLTSYGMIAGSVGPNPNTERVCGPQVPVGPGRSDRRSKPGGFPAEVQPFPRLVQPVLDCLDARRLAEFYRQLLGLAYRPGDEAPEPGRPDPRGDEWLVLEAGAGDRRLAFQQVATLPQVTWPDGPIPQQMHLDLAVPTLEEFEHIAAAIPFCEGGVKAAGVPRPSGRALGL